MLRGFLITLVVLACGCDSVIYGAGTVYVWNGTEQLVELQSQGRTPFSTKLRPKTGQLFNDVVAGDYTVSARRGPDKAKQLPVTVHKELLTIINADGVGCFARANVFGMYSKGVDPVKLSELYSEQPVIQMQGMVDVLPGERLPAAAPRKPYSANTFLRIVVVPCDLMANEGRAEEKVTDFIKRLR